MVRVKDTIRLRLEKMVDRYEEIGRSLADPAVIGRQREFRDLSVEYARLTPVAEKFDSYRSLERELAAAREMQGDGDPAMRDMGAEEAARLAPAIEQAEGMLKMMLIPRDPRDDKNIYLEVRAGTGGDEAAIFAGDLFRMYSRYAETQGFTVEVLSENPGEHGGYREVISRIAGSGAFARFKFESGVHRVQRVPATEAQGRIHTSAVTVAILPEPDEVEATDLNPAELRVDTYRASGAGGQHVNKTESAIRITHLPTGIVVESQTERSQHANRDKAMKRLKAMLVEADIARREAAQAQDRKLQVGSGDRSQRIRTYNFPQGRVTDHRVEGLTLYRLPEIVAGDLDELVDRLTREHQVDELKLLTEAA
jgi:peptide chain release factor 1